jgi:hypothetical protein
VIEIGLSLGWDFNFLSDLAMDILGNIDIERIAAGLAILVLVQLVLELRAIHRRSSGASRRAVFLQVQGRRLPGAKAGARVRPVGSAGPDRGGH